jgi:hypothetical protein
VNIEAELVKATGIKPKDGEDRQKYLVRVVEKLHTLDDDAFYALSKPTQKWANNAVEAHDADQPIADFAAPNGKDGKHTTTKEKPVTKKAPAKDKPKEKKGITTAVRGDGIKDRIKALVWKNPSVGVDDLMEKLAKNGPTPSRLTVSSIRSEFRHSLKWLVRNGHLKIEL